MRRSSLFWNLSAAACALVIALSVTACGNFFVSGSTVTSITVSPTNSVLQVGDTEQLSATGKTADGYTVDVTPGATWTSSDRSVATISAGGLVTAVGGGTADIEVKYQDGRTKTFVVVTSATLSSISVTPSNESITAGATKQFVASGTYSDGASRTITSNVTWTSSRPGVATISSTGLATGVSAGSTAITATSGATYAMTNLTVTK